MKLSNVSHQGQPSEGSPKRDVETARKLNQQGNELLISGKLLEAAAMYEDALVADPLYANICVNLGFVLKELGKTDAAKHHLERAIQINPQLEDALHLLGQIAESQGNLKASIKNLEAAVKLKPDFLAAWSDLTRVYAYSGRIEDAKLAVEKGIALDPQAATLHFYLGNIHQQEEASLLAVECYDLALSLKPDFSEAHYNRGNSLVKLKRLEDALESYDHAISVKPDYAEAHCSRGHVLLRQGKLVEAIESYRATLLIRPDFAVAYFGLGNALHAQGKPKEAAERYQQAIRLDPQQFEGVQHLISALTGKMTERPSNQYIENLFDDYADKFDAHLKNDLGYKTPKELVSLLKRSVGLLAGGLDVLDLGCGTGLSGLEIAPYARQLVGVDLSSKMLEKARALNIYARLEHSDLLSMMNGEDASKYDVIIAADVFVYLGRLEEIISEAKRLLRPSGFLLFSVEALDELASDKIDSFEYKLNQTGRYAHSAKYLENLAYNNFFTIIGLSQAQLRVENKMPVIGWLALWKVTPH